MAGLIDPGDVFHDAHVAGSALLDKVDTGQPTTKCMDKCDMEKYILYLSSTMSSALYGIGLTMDKLITEPIQGTGGMITVDQRKARLHEIISKPIIALGNIEYFCHQSSKKFEEYHIDETTSPINPVPIFTLRDTSETVNDSSLKTTIIFDGKGTKGQTDDPETLQTFLRGIFDVQRTSTLNEITTVKLCQRRCVGNARTLLDSFLAELGDLSKPGTLLKVVLFLEGHFSLSWTPRLSKQALSSLQVKFKNTKNFVGLQAKILQLSHLASLGEPVADRPAFMKSHQLPVFLACLSRSDQDILLKMESQRAASSQPPMGLSSAVNCLLQHHAARIITSGEHDTSDSMINNSPSEEQVMYLPQHNSAPRQRDQQRSSSTPAHPPGFKQRRQRSESQRRPNIERSNQERSQYKKNNDQKEPIWKKYGVAKGTCVACTSNRHLLGDPACYYKAYSGDLPPSSCRVPGCRGGAHYSAICRHRTAPPSGSQQRTSRGRERGAPRSRGSRRTRGTTRSDPAQRLHRAEDVMAITEALPDNIGNPNAFYLDQND